MFHHHPALTRALQEDRFYRPGRERRRQGVVDRPARPVHKVR
jgi:hypothetical protein